MGATTVEILRLVGEHGRPGAVVMVLSLAEHIAHIIDGVVVAEDSGAFIQAISTICMDVTGITQA